MSLQIKEWRFSGKRPWHRVIRVMGGSKILCSFLEFDAGVAELIVETIESKNGCRMVE